MEELKARTEQLEKMLKMKEESFAEEREEFKLTQTNMHNDNTLLFAEKKELESKLTSLQQRVYEQGDLEERLMKLETALSGKPSATAGDDLVSDDREMGKEKAIELTFGDDTSPHLLEKFIAHYSLIDRINTARGVRVWKKPEYRALMLRSALRGAAGEFIENAEYIMLTTWVKDDQEIIKKLRERYITNSAIELRIIEFETASQLEGEPLSEYMVRLQRLMEKAYASHPQYVKQVRVVWQFLNGLKDRDVREALIKEKWMEDGEKAKSYDEILKIAETVANAKVASRATGQVNGQATKNGVINAMSRDPAGKKSPKNKGKYLGSNNPYNAGASNRRENWSCWYCEKRDHEGGWQRCPLREEKDPQWKPGKKQSGFGRPPRQ